MYRLSSLLCASLYILLSCSVLDAAVTIQLRESVSLNRAQVYLSDIAHSNMDAEQWAEISGLPIQRLAGAGPYAISARRVQTLLQHKGLRGAIRIRGIAQVRRTLRTITAEEIFTLARAHMLQRIEELRANETGSGGNWSDIDIQQLRAAKEISVFAEDEKTIEQGTSQSRILSEPLTHNIYGQVPYRIRFMNGPRETGRSLVILNVRVHREVAVAQRALPKGRVLGAADVIMTRVFVHERQQQDAPSIDGVIGKVLRASLPKGATVFQSSIREPHAVRGGQIVDVLYAREQFQLTLRGIAQGAAAIGENVQVRGIDGGHIIIATVIAKDLVEIQ